MYIELWLAFWIKIYWSYSPTDWVSLCPYMTSGPNQEIKLLFSIKMFEVFWLCFHKFRNFNTCLIFFSNLLDSRCFVNKVKYVTFMVMDLLHPWECSIPQPFKPQESGKFDSSWVVLLLKFTSGPKQEIKLSIFIKWFKIFGSFWKITCILTIFQCFSQIP